MSRVKMDPKGRLAQSFAGITQMKYFQPTYFLETSTSTVLQGMKELFRAAKLKPGTNPIR